MVAIIYLDAINGSDTLGNGTKLNPYKTLQYFCNSIAVKTNADYEVLLQNGTYEITSGTIFGQFSSGNMTIIGKGQNTEIIQKTNMYTNSSGGNINFSLTIAKCKYNILTTLAGNNLIGFNWTWYFYNVLFEYTPNNALSVLSTNGRGLIFRNCVKLTNTTSFLRKNSSVIEIYDSIGYFTSGYMTTQSDWNKSGNKIGSIDGYERFLNKGYYSWSDKILVKNEDKIYSLDAISSNKDNSVFEIPILSKDNFINYGKGLENFSKIFKEKKYVLQNEVSENEEGLWTTKLDRKPLSISFN